MRKLFNDEAGFVVSAELALIVTLIFTAVAVGVAVARDALVNEYNDISEMIGVVDQTYNVAGQNVSRGSGVEHALNKSFGYNDGADDCDCKDVEWTNVCGKDDPSNNGTNEGV